jgi:hypothetical protein|tara:strand:- start:3344 stop:3649 length:306 start_codon:yes stop_codon:yes gene_type:complete
MSNVTNVQNAWVESGAMVYVSLTVATFSAIVMCCTWFVTHNRDIKQWWSGENYGVVDDGEDIELTVESDEEPNEEVIFDSRSDGAFTLEGSSDEEERKERV